MAVPSRLALWFGLAGPPAYAAHLVVTFWLVPVACAQEAPWVLLVATIASAAVAAAAVVVAIRSRRRLRSAPDDRDPASPDRHASRLGPRASAAARIAARFLLIPAIMGSVGRSPERSEPAGNVAVSPRPLFMATTGMYLSALSLAIILLAGYPILVLDPC